MIAGFTGTREGLTHSQLYSLRQYLVETAPTTLHHGCCVGADASVHKIIRTGFPSIKIVGHPGPAGHLRMTIREEEFHKLYPIKDYSLRNTNIVRVGSQLLAAPKFTPSEDLMTALHTGNGGTWQTVRKARMAGKPVIVFWPSGRVVIWAVGSEQTYWSPK